jgi:hypothetical protein
MRRKKRKKEKKKRRRKKSRKRDGVGCEEEKKVRKKNRKRRRRESEFGEMVITSAFQADFVGSSPIIRIEKEGFQRSNKTRKERNGVLHCDKPVRGGYTLR